LQVRSFFNDFKLLPASKSYFAQCRDFF
jgi:hypothetical protein